MTAQTFVAWVKPVAEELRESRAEVARTAQQLLPEHWTMPSPLEGWSYKDLLAHLASGDWVFQTMLRDVLGIEKGLPENPSMTFVDEGNARRLAERKDTSAEELIAEVGTSGETTQELLSQVSDAIDRGLVAWRRPNGDPVTLEQWVLGFARHDAMHLAQLRTALDQVML
jgi:uncharacterized protein (TIGR03083 family)